MLDIIASYKARLTGNMMESRKFLVDVGIYKPDGELTDNYKNILNP